MQLCYLQALSNITGDRTTAIVLPVPGELMNLMMRGEKNPDCHCKSPQ